MDKLRAHQDGVLHRALSVFIFNSKGEMLMQRRAMGKYHSSGLWTNTCCSHPRPGEATKDAAVRRLKEEMGISASLSQLFSFVYMAPVGEAIFEYEFDHVYMGYSDADPKPDPEEAMEWKWIPTAEIASDLDANPGKYTIWFQIIFKEVIRLAQGK